MQQKNIPALLEKRLGLCLFFCRLALFIVFFVWTLNKLIRPEFGAGIVAKHYLVPDVPAIAIFLFGILELVICFVFVLGFYKRLTRGFFLCISTASLVTPRVVNGYRLAILESPEPQLLLFSGFCMFACALNTLCVT